MFFPQPGCVQQAEIRLGGSSVLLNFQRGHLSSSCNINRVGGRRRRPHAWLLTDVSSRTQHAPGPAGHQICSLMRKMHLGKRVPAVLLSSPYLVLPRGKTLSSLLQHEEMEAWRRCRTSTDPELRKSGIGGVAPSMVSDGRVTGLVGNDQFREPERHPMP